MDKTISTVGGKFLVNNDLRHLGTMIEKLQNREMTLQPSILYTL